jgi:pimeloyl-ACP methyl ester carboxylesterase
VGCSFGAGVAVEVTLDRPAQVASLVLAAPGGALITERTAELRAFIDAENAALERGDLHEAAEANVRTWVDGSHRAADAVSSTLRDAVRAMQYQAFEVSNGWPDAVWEAEQELDPPAVERLAEIAVPTLVVTGDLDVDAIGLAADHLTAVLPQARRERWPGVAHLPPMERPEAFAAAVLQHSAAA